MTVQAAEENRHGAKVAEIGLRGGGIKAGLEGVKREDLACFRQEVGGDWEKNLRKMLSSSLSPSFNSVSLLSYPLFLL